MNTPRTIHLLDKRLHLSQLEAGFKSSIDAVLLAAACPAKKGDRILDLGCGVGTAGLCAMARVSGATLHGIDIQDDHIEAARANAHENGMDERCVFEASDIRNFKEEQYDHVICNPPYHQPGAHIESPSHAKAIAMGHKDTVLQDWLDAANRALKHGGSFCIIHKAEYADHIIRGLKTRFGAVEIIPLWPKAGQNAKRVIIRAVRNSKSVARIHAGITLHSDDGEYTREAENILRSMAPIL